MQIIRNFCRQGCVVLIGVCITACVTSPSPNSSAPAVIHPTVSQFVQVATTVVPLRTPVPVIQQTVTVGSDRWTLSQPKGITPIIATNSSGILWVQFPPMETNANIEKYAIDPLPQGDYAIMYTPLRDGGGMLAQDAKHLLLVPNIIGQDDVTINGVMPAGPNHFLLALWELP